jgi:hypothetical protein
MKYPQEQFEKLVAALKTIKEKRPDIIFENLHVSTVHYFVYKNLRFPSNNPNVAFMRDGSRLLEIDETFELYPNDTNDDHVATAVRKALKLTN